MFRLQVILKVASPWRNSKISRVCLPGSDGSMLSIAQALHCGDPRSNCTEELPHSVLLRLYDLMGKLQIDVKMLATKTTKLSFFLSLFLIYHEGSLCRLKYSCLQVTLWNSSKLSSAGLSWEHDHVLILPDLVTAVRHPVIATCQGSVQVCRYKYAGIWQSTGACSSPSWCELLYMSRNLHHQSRKRVRQDIWDWGGEKPPRHYSDYCTHSSFTSLGILPAIVSLI